MVKRYLNKGDRCFTTGAFIVWDGEKFVLDGIEDDTYYDGELINFDKKDRPYAED